MKAATVPNTMTEPASLKIFPPTPKTYPSVRCSMAADATELANPVTVQLFQRQQIAQNDHKPQSP